MQEAKSKVEKIIDKQRAVKDHYKYSGATDLVRYIYNWSPNHGLVILRIAHCRIMSSFPYPRIIASPKHFLT